MEPKFQSSFIPKGPLASSAGSNLVKRPKEKSLFGYIGMVVFVLSVLLAGGVFGYKYYLKNRIASMEASLEQARADLDLETIEELMNLDRRIKSTKQLVSKHVVLTPLFEFLEIFTPKTLRFNDFKYSVSDGAIKLSMKGEARGYAALAAHADIINKSEHFKDPVFSDLTLSPKGDVVFSFTATVDPNLVSYLRQVEPPAVESSQSADTDLDSLIDDLDSLEPLPDLDTI